MMSLREINSSTNGRPVFGKPIAEEAAKFRIASLLWMAGITMLMVPMATLVDVPISRWFSHEPLSNEIGQVLDLSSYYAHGTGVFLILLGVIVLAPRRRWYVPRLATLAMGGGAVSTLTKMFVLRPRPNCLNLDAASYDYAWIWSFDWTLDHIANFDASTRAFPSASLATATALTAGLWVVLPRARWFFVMICVGTMLQRLACGAHFVSDLFGSASIGLAWAFVCFHPSLMGSLFEKMEPERNPRRRSKYHSDAESDSRIGVPSIGVPSIGVPSIGVPSIGVPSIGVPSIGAPSIGVPSIGGATLTRHVQSSLETKREYVSDKEDRFAA